MLTLAMVTWPASSSEIWSSAGAICLHGPHHSAQKSTRTGPSAFSTDCSKVSSVTGTVLIEQLPRAADRRRALRLAHVVKAGGTSTRCGHLVQGPKQEIFWDRHELGAIGPDQSGFDSAAGEDLA